MPVVQHRVINVPVVLTALLVRQVVRILQLLVLLEPMPVGQQLFVIHVVLGNTTISQAKLLIVSCAVLVNIQQLQEEPVIAIRVAAPARTSVIPRPPPNTTKNPIASYAVLVNIRQ